MTEVGRRSRLERLSGNLQIGADWRAEEHALAQSAWSAIHRGLMSTSAVLSSAAGAAVLSNVEGTWRAVVGVLALVAAVLAAVDTTLAASVTAENHKRAADRFTALRTKWVTFREVTLPARTEDDAAAEFEILIAERDKVSDESPLPPYWAKRRVQRRRNEMKDAIE
jgi:hypothetical protein